MPPTAPSSSSGAAATLHRRGRALRGRLIHEGLASTRLNLLSRLTFFGLAGLEFLYLTAGDPADAVADVYLQKTVGGAALSGMPALTGYATARRPTAQSSTARCRT